MPKPNIRSNDLFVPRTILIALAVLCALGLTLAGAPAAHALTYSVEGAFDESNSNFDLGIAVDQTSGEVYVAKLFGTDKFSAAGQLEAPTPFVNVNSGEYDVGVAVDPRNQNVYVNVLNTNTQTPTPEVETYTSSGAKVGSFAVPGSVAIVEIASDSSGDVYYPDKQANAVLKFSPTGTLEATIEGEPAGVGAFKEPQGVAVDGSGNVYVADSGNGRTVRVEAGTGAQSVIDAGGTQDVAVDPVSGDVFALDLNSKGSCEALSAPCYRVRAYHSGETTPFAEFGAGTIHNEGTPNTPNHVAVDHSTSKVYVSDYNDKVWIFAPGTPPKVAYPTPPVTGMTATEATLHGEVNPQGNETSCRFEYGTSTTYEHSVPCQPELVGEGSKFKPEAVTISGLEGNTEYHFRLVATTAAGGLVDGADQTFTTSQAPPAVLASSVLASKVTQSDVFFNATINPQHLDTHYWFNYSSYPFEDASGCTPTAPYASAPATPVDMGAGTGPEAVELDLAGADVVLHPGMGSRELQPNTVYRFQVVADNASGTTCEPEATFITLPPDPLAGTGAASAITQTAATLSGTVTPGSTGPNSDTTWYFQYGTSTAYGLFGPATVNQGTYQAAPQDAGMGTSPVAVSTALAGLTPNTTYHYRLRASNANADPAADPAAAPQIAHGADHTFTTPPSEPLLDEPSGLTETGVTLNGAADPGGHDLRYSFQYGTSADYGQSSPTEDAGEGATFTPVSATLTGLTPGVTYHYRLAATGGGGSSYSQDSTFTLYTPAPAQAGNPFNPGQSTPAPFPTLALLSTPAFPAQPSEATPPPLTNAQKLARALRACRKDKAKSRRRRCEKAARKRYTTVARKTSGKS